MKFEITGSKLDSMHKEMEMFCKEAEKEYESQIKEAKKKFLVRLAGKGLPDFIAMICVKEGNKLIFQTSLALPPLIRRPITKKMETNLVKFLEAKGFDDAKVQFIGD